MIRNKLSILLTERGIKATKVANDTGIARSTLSKISNNSSEKIEYATINTLCRYLKITPCDFFEYLPFDIDFFVSIDETLCSEPALGEPSCWKIEAFLNVDNDSKVKSSYEFAGFLEDYGHSNNEFDSLGVYIEPVSDDEALDLYILLGDTPQTFLTDITKKFEIKIEEAIKEFGLKPFGDFININLLNKRK